MTKFQESVIRVVNQIPVGKVVSYGQVALYIGLPRSAREVGWILRGLNDLQKIPWWRVINNAGIISIKGNTNADANLQMELLQSEGVDVDINYRIDIQKYRWVASKEELQSLQLDADYIETVLHKYTQPFIQNSLLK